MYQQAQDFSMQECELNWSVTTLDKVDFLSWNNCKVDIFYSRFVPCKHWSNWNVRTLDTIDFLGWNNFKLWKTPFNKLKIISCRNESSIGVLGLLIRLTFFNGTFSNC